MLYLKSGATNTICLNQLAALFDKLGKKIPDIFSTTEAQIGNNIQDKSITYIFLPIKICILH